MKPSNLLKVTSAILALFMFFTLAACKNEENPSNPDTASSASGAATTAGTPAAAEDTDPLGKYDPPIKLTTVRTQLTKQLVLGAA